VKYLKELGLGLVLSAVSLGAAAQGFDGSQPLICASVETYDCEPGGDCIKGLAADINAPQFIRLDFETGVAKTTRADGEERQARFSAPVQESGRMILQGVQNGLGWSMTIVEESGAMTLTVSGNELAIVIFGACTPL
jgi:hypothetical protein